MLLSARLRSEGTRLCLRSTVAQCAPAANRYAFHEPAATATHFLSERARLLLQVVLAPSMCLPNGFNRGQSATLDAEGVSDLLVKAINGTDEIQVSLYTRTLDFANGPRSAAQPAPQSPHHPLSTLRTLVRSAAAR